MLRCHPELAGDATPLRIGIYRDSSCTVPSIIITNVTLPNGNKIVTVNDDLDADNYGGCINVQASIITKIRNMEDQDMAHAEYYARAIKFVSSNAKVSWQTEVTPHACTAATATVASSPACPWSSANTMNVVFGVLVVYLVLRINRDRLPPHALIKLLFGMAKGEQQLVPVSSIYDGK